MEFKCKVCNQIYKTERQAQACEEDHSFIYVKLYREDLFRLLQFLYSKDESILTERLVNTLRKYNTGSYV